MLGYLATCCTDRLIELTDILFLTSLIPLLLVIFKVSSPLVGVLLLGTFFANVYYMARKKMPAIDVDKPRARGEKIMFIVAKLAFTMAAALVASHLLVSSGLSIAANLGAPPILIGAKVVAIGTSLPELTVDFMAVRRGRVQLAIGDIIGSNLTNLTLVLGLVLLSSPFAVDMTIFTEILPFLLITTLILWRFLNKGGVTQTGGVILIFTYIMFQAVVMG
jgi:cation:H+ antiporter